MKRGSPTHPAVASSQMLGKKKALRMKNSLVGLDTFNPAKKKKQQQQYASRNCGATVTCMLLLVMNSRIK